MPDVPSRAELERKLGRQLSAANRQTLSNLMDALGDPPRIENLPPGFWSQAESDLFRAMVPFLQEVYLAQAEHLLSAIPIGVDWGLVNEAAVTWANEFNFRTIKGITDTTMRAVQKSLSGYFQTAGMTRGDLERQLSPLFGPVRSEMIAVTEITRAASEGERAVARELHGAGIDMVPFWYTNNDDRVCPICGGKHGQQIEGSDFPPAHVRCRCWVNYRLPKVQRG